MVGNCRMDNISIFVVRCVKVAVELGLPFTLVNDLYELIFTAWCFYSYHKRTYYNCVTHTTVNNTKFGKMRCYFS